MKHIIFAFFVSTPSPIVLHEDNIYISLSFVESKSFKIGVLFFVCAVIPFNLIFVYFLVNSGNSFNNILLNTCLKFIWLSSLEKLTTSDPLSDFFELLE